MSKPSDNSGVIARAYTPSDQRVCLTLFDGNVPEFFDASERPDFEHFLIRDTQKLPYQVLERDGRILGCGGLAIEEDGVTASLCWGMIDRELQGTGLGRILTESRLRLAETTPGVTQVQLHTSQHTRGFYATFGFQTEKVTPNAYGPGLDRWDMLLRFGDGEPAIG